MFSLDLSPLLLSLRLAAFTTIILIILATPLAWWLANTKSKFKSIIEAITAMPLVLPPTVMGFYLLLFLNPTSPIGSAWFNLTGNSLTFSFTGLVLASIIYSMPFAVQPIQGAFEAIGRAPLEAAATLRASPFDSFISIAMPLALRGFLTATVLSFAHTIGEFGIVLMVGGNIPQKTKVISIAIYEHVETLQYGQAHTLSLILLAFSFITLVSVYSLNKKFPIKLG